MKKQIPAPVGGNRDFEPTGGPPDGGEKSYRVAGIAPTGSETGSSHGGNEVEPVNSQFGNLREPIKIDTGGTWKSTPGSPGVDPTEGSYSWREDPPPPDSSSDSTNRKCTTCCFAAGTPILMADGSSKAIERVVVGDRVAAFDEAGKTIIDGEVLALESPERDHLSTLTFADGRTLQLTDEHPLYTRDGWASIDPGFTMKNYKMPTEKLRAGAEVFGTDGNWHKIVSLSTILREVKVYNLSWVEPGRTFFANGLLAHNKPTCECEVCKPGGGGEAGGNANTTSGGPGSGSSGNATDNTVTGQPGSADGGANTADGTGNNPGAGGSGIGTSGGPGSAGGQANTSGSNSGGNPGNTGGSTGNSGAGPGTSGSGTAGSSSGGGGSSHTGSGGSSGSGSISPPSTTPRRTGGGF